MVLVVPQKCFCLVGEYEGKSRKVETSDRWEWIMESGFEEKMEILGFERSTFVLALSNSNLKRVLVLILRSRISRSD